MIRPMGVLSRRIHGAESIMRKRAVSAREVARSFPSDSQHAAALRGKANGYDEAADLIHRLSQGLRLPAKSDWRERGES